MRGSIGLQTPSRRAQLVTSLQAFTDLIVCYTHNRNGPSTI